MLVEDTFVRWGTLIIVLEGSIDGLNQENSVLLRKAVGTGVIKTHDMQSVCPWRSSALIHKIRKYALMHHLLFPNVYVAYVDRSCTGSRKTRGRYFCYDVRYARNDETRAIFFFKSSSVPQQTLHSVCESGSRCTIFVHIFVFLLIFNASSGKISFSPS